MSKPTPGPWDSHDEDEIMAGDWDKHVATAWNNDKIEPGEATANARLIAAAPDLLAACGAAMDVLLACCVPAGASGDREKILATQQMLRAAMRKAEGEPTP